MPDPHLLYVVSAVVVMALVAWVIAVIARAPVLPDVRVQIAAIPVAAPPPPTSLASEGSTDAAAPKPSEPQSSVKPRLSAHLEIQDEKDGTGKTDKS
jgi:hypothetical protein